MSRRLIRIILVGLCATLMDLGTLHLMHSMSTHLANIISLIVGAHIQFLGNRYIVYPESQHRSFWRQLIAFFFAESFALLCNAALFEGLVHFTSPAIARLCGSFLVFLAVNLPLWYLIFHPKAQAPQQRDAP